MQLRRISFGRYEIVRQEAAPLRRSVVSAVYGGSTSGEAIAKGEKARPGKRAPTVEERAWMDGIVAYGCIACRIDGRGVVPPAVHHILRGGRRMGHMFTLPLCPGHHQHDTASGLIARHPYKARFESRYGTEFELLELLRSKIGSK